MSVDRVPDLLDVDGKGWPEALAALKPTKCIHLVPAFGRIGSCADIARIRGWDGYAGLHVQNANRAYLRMERDSFND